VAGLPHVGAVAATGRLEDSHLLKLPLADPLSAIELPQHVEIAVHVTGGGFCLNDIL